MRIGNSVDESIVGGPEFRCSDDQSEKRKSKKETFNISENGKKNYFMFATYAHRIPIHDNPFDIDVKKKRDGEREREEK